MRVLSRGRTPGSTPTSRRAAHRYPRGRGAAYLPPAARPCKQLIAVYAGWQDMKGSRAAPVHQLREGRIRWHSNVFSQHRLRIPWDSSIVTHVRRIALTCVHYRKTVI